MTVKIVIAYQAQCTEVLYLVSTQVSLYNMPINVYISVYTGYFTKRVNKAYKTTWKANNEVIRTYPGAILKSYKRLNDLNWLQECLNIVFFLCYRGLIFPLLSFYENNFCKNI